MIPADAPARPGFDYAAHDATALADLVRRREVTAEELLDAAIARVEALNPALNAVVHRMYDRARRELAAVPDDAPFAGVPFLVKDLLTAVAGEPLRSGSRFLKDLVADIDSEVTLRLRRAGFVIFGKTNTPELGLMQVTESELYGPARNPWDPSRTPGGSSGGAGAAVASGMVPIAAGGDGAGSLRIPAACCGVFGLKPSRGRIPTGPFFGELWRGYVTEGAITRSVRDMAGILDVLSGPDIGAPYAAPPHPRPYRAEVGAPPGRLRIAVTAEPPIPVPVHGEARAAVERAARICRELGHEVVEAAPAFDGMELHRDYVTVIAACAAADLDLAIRMVGRRPRRGELETQTALLARMGHAVDAAQYESAARRLQLAARRIAAFHESFDVLLSPVTAEPPLRIGTFKPSGLDAFAQELLHALRTKAVFRLRPIIDRMIVQGFRFTPFVNAPSIVGQPAMSVPLHWTPDGLPVGVQVVGRANDEATLIRLAAQLEMAAPWAHRRPPRAA